MTVDLPQPLPVNTKNDLPGSSKSPSSPITKRPKFSTSELPNNVLSEQPPPAESYSSWSASSDKLGGPSGDRVFPIRSVVSVDTSQTPYQSSRNSGEVTDYFPPTAPRSKDTSSPSFSPQHLQNHRPVAESDGRPTPRLRKEEPQPVKEPRRQGRRASNITEDGADRYAVASQRLHLFNDASSDRSQNTGDSGSFKSSRTGGADEDYPGALYTARFKHMVTTEGHAVVTGRGGDTLQRCEDEPIHIPGAVQAFGVLIALEEKEEGQLLVRVVSENSRRLLGYTPQELFKLQSFTDILSDEQQVVISPSRGRLPCR